MALKSVFPMALFAPTIVCPFVLCGFWSAPTGHVTTVEASAVRGADISFLPENVKQTLIRHYPNNPSSVRIPTNKVGDVFAAINNESGHYRGKDAAQFGQFLMHHYGNNMPQYWNRDSLALALLAFDQNENKK